MPPCRTAFAVFLAVFCATPAFSADTAQSDIEARFKREVSAENIGAYLETLTARPNYPGAPFSKEAAEITADWFEEWGWSVRIDEYQVPFPDRVERSVELLGDEPFKAVMNEPAVEGDPYSQNRSEYLETFFIYAPDGDVTAPAIYVNYGLREDYELLEEMGQSAKGKIVVARYGRGWRGGKTQLAAEHGAVGILIYSDPHEDGYFQGDVYPEGGWKPRDGVQRGSVLDGSYAGDPTTPLAPSLPGQKRLPVNSKKGSFAKIPGQPLSYGDAEPILANMEGPVAPESWRGSLPITYKAGPTSAPVRLKTSYDWKDITIRNVIATLPGDVYADETVIRGNHRDGWVYGAQDPHSGHSAMLEEARVLGLLYKEGWRPNRTIVFASWDAEEQGVLGSAEFVDQYLPELRKNAVAYLNTDVTGPGTLAATGAASLTDMVAEVADSVIDPNSGLSLLGRLNLKNETNLYGDDTGFVLAPSSAKDGSKEAGLKLGPPGYGSDHQAFVSRAGVAALGLMIGFDQLNLGAYHTVYDNAAWYKKFSDPGYRYGVATAQLNGLALLRLADAGILPMHFGHSAEAVKAEFANLEKLYSARKSEIEMTNRAIETGAYKGLSHRESPRVAPKKKSAPDLDLAPISSAVDAVTAAAKKFEAAREGVEAQNLSKPEIERINAALMRVERSYLRDGGLPGRPYYENELYSPGRLWDTVPFPGVGDAILDGDWRKARAEIPRAAATVRAIAAAIDEAAAELESASGD